MLITAYSMVLNMALSRTRSQADGPATRADEDDLLLPLTEGEWSDIVDTTQFGKLNLWAEPVKRGIQRGTHK